MSSIILKEPGFRKLMYIYIYIYTYIYIYLYIYMNYIYIYESLKWPQWRKVDLSSAEKIISIIRGTTSKHYSDFYYLNCLHSFRTKNKV